MQDTIAKIRKFRDERDWKQFHDPRSLAVSVSIEAAELLEHFQWKDGAQAAEQARLKKGEIADEVADVAIYLLELCDVLDIDVAQAIIDKLGKNALKYPVAKSRGRVTKYSDL